MISNRRQFIKLRVRGTGLSLPFVVIVLTFLCIATSVSAQELSQTQQPRVQPRVQPDLTLIKTCATNGYTCASGYSCTLNTTSLGTPSLGGAFVPTYACTSSNNSCSNGCLPGWKIDGLSGSGYKCTPLGGLCKTGLIPWPAPSGGYYCMTLLQG